MLGKIYKITNKINGKIYIGQTVKSLKERFQKHCWGTTEKDSYHLNMAIKKAIRKYGKQNFTIELIEEVEQNKLDERKKITKTLKKTSVSYGNCPAFPAHALKPAAVLLTHFHGFKGHISTNNMPKCLQQL